MRGERLRWRVRGEKDCEVESERRESGRVSGEKVGGRE